MQTAKKAEKGIILPRLWHTLLFPQAEYMVCCVFTIYSFSVALG